MFLLVLTVKSFVPECSEQEPYVMFISFSEWDILAFHFHMQARPVQWRSFIPCCWNSSFEIDEIMKCQKTAVHGISNRMKGHCKDYELSYSICLCTLHIPKINHIKAFIQHFNFLLEMPLFILSLPFESDFCLLSCRFRPFCFIPSSVWRCLCFDQYTTGGGGVFQSPCGVNFSEMCGMFCVFILLLFLFYLCLII